MRQNIVGLIPAGGSGTRLYPFSKAVPKELYPIVGKAVIEHCVENLKEGGVNKVFIIVGHQKGALMDYIGDGSLFGVRVAYIYQLERRGLGHAILQAKNWIDSTFVTLLGDSFIEPKWEIKNLINLHAKEKPLATLLLSKVDDPKSYGIAKFRRKSRFLEVERLIEKPSKKDARGYRVDGGYYAICGAYVFEPRIFDFIEQTRPGRGKEIQITDSLALALKRGERILGVELEGKYLDIGKWGTILKVEKDMLQKQTIEFHERGREALAKRVKEKWGDSEDV
jgi:dTDP-glucose pyrophosphorylase